MIDAAAIVAGLGGAENIVEIEPCTTRLRTEVRDASLVDEAVLKRAGAIAVMRTGANTTSAACASLTRAVPRCRRRPCRLRAQR